MTEIRGASLAAHDAARDARENDAACFAAHAAGQAVATAHVPQHAYSGANYALKSVAADDPTNAEVKITKERSWQSQHLSGHLRQEIMKRIMIQQKGKRMIVKIQKVRVSNPRLNESEGQNAAQWPGILRHYGKQFSTPQHFFQLDGFVVPALVVESVETQRGIPFTQFGTVAQTFSQPRKEQR